MSLCRCACVAVNYEPGFIFKLLYLAPHFEIQNKTLCKWKWMVLHKTRLDMDTKGKDEKAYKTWFPYPSQVPVDKIIDPTDMYNNMA